jgi:hypothetical protein
MGLGTCVYAAFNILYNMKKLAFVIIIIFVVLGSRGRVKYGEKILFCKNAMNLCQMLIFTPFSPWRILFPPYVEPYVTPHDISNLFSFVTL